MTNKIRQIALTGLAAIAVGCGGGGGTTVSFATEAEGRLEIRTKLQADKAASRIDEWAEDLPVQIQGRDLYPDFAVRNGQFWTYLEYISEDDPDNIDNPPSHPAAPAEEQIRILFDNGIDYCYIPKKTIADVRTEVENYSTDGYVGQHPKP